MPNVKACILVTEGACASPMGLCITGVLILHSVRGPVFHREIYSFEGPIPQGGAYTLQRDFDLPEESCQNS